MAEQAGLPIRTDPMQRGCTHSEIVRFARKVAQIAIAGEREACAVTAWNTGMDLHTKQHDSREIGSACARAIRARGEKVNNGEVKE